MEDGTKKGRGCFLTLLIASFFMMLILFVFYFKGREMTLSFLQWGVKRSFLKMLPSDYPPEKRQEVEKGFEELFRAVKKQQIPDSDFQVVIYGLQAAMADEKVTGEEVEKIAGDIRETLGKVNRPL